MQSKTFAALKDEARNASSLPALYRAVDAANGKLYGNIAKAKLLSYTHGAAADADHYFQNVIPGWQRIVSEINAIWTAAVAGKSAEEIVSIITEASPSAA